MRVLNKTKNKLVAEEPLILDSFFSRLRGLMFRLTFPRPLLFIFPDTSPKRNSIHSFFVFLRFDAVYLDDGKKVTDIFENIRQFTPYIEPSSPVRYLLELEAGSVKKLNIEVGDRMEF